MSKTQQAPSGTHLWLVGWWFEHLIARIVERVVKLTPKRQALIHRSSIVTRRCWNARLAASARRKRTTLGALLKKLGLFAEKLAESNAAG